MSQGRIEEGGVVRITSKIFYQFLVLGRVGGSYALGVVEERWWV